MRGSLHGNSLLGLTDRRQLEALHITPSQASADRLFDLAEGGKIIQHLDVAGVLAKAASLRRRLATEVNDDDPQRSATTKRRQWREYQALTAQLRDIGDGVIAAGLRLGGKPGKALIEAYENLRIAVGQAYPADGREPDRTMLDAIQRHGLTPTVETDYERWQPLHWILAVPDVMEGGGFDAIVGNPPFLGGQKLTGAFGTNLRDWLVNVLANGRRGNADLVAYFFLRAGSLLAVQGGLGLIATNTVAQGNTREVGLDQLAESGFTIIRAIQSRSWPVSTANLEYAAVWGTRTSVGSQARRIADGVEVDAISTLLEPIGRIVGSPIRLAQNARIAYEGFKVYGMGFVLDPDEATEWIRTDPNNADVLFPYLSGEDVASRPDLTPSRWVIDFNDRSEHAAAQYQLPYERVLERVKDDRQKANRKAIRERWWQYAEKRPALRKAIARLNEVLVIAKVSKAVMPVRVPTGQVFSNMLGVFATAAFDDQAVLSSSLHQLWATKYSSTLETRVLYIQANAFETFPRPIGTSRLREIGMVLHTERRDMMLHRELGLTKLYNLVNDSDISNSADKDIARLRQIHVEIDEAVMAAYGWDTVPLDHGFHTYRQMTRWTISPYARVEVFDRLLEENHRRAGAQGEAPPPADEDEIGEDE